MDIEQMHQKLLMETNRYTVNVYYPVSPYKYGTCVKAQYLILCLNHRSFAKGCGF